MKINIPEQVVRHKTFHFLFIIIPLMIGLCGLFGDLYAQQPSTQPAIPIKGSTQPDQKDKSSKIDLVKEIKGLETQIVSNTDAINKRINDLNAQIASNKDAISFAKETESRTWNLVITLLVGLLLLVLGAGISIFAIPQRIVKKAIDKINKEGDRFLQKLVSDINEEKESLEKHVDSLTKELRKNVSSEIIFIVGRQLYNEKKLDQAIKSFDEAITIDSENTDAFYYRGLSYKRKGRQFFDNAMSDLKKAFSNQKYNNDPEIIFSIAETFFNNSNLEEARGFAQRSIDVGYKNKAVAITLIADTFRIGSRDLDKSLLNNAIAKYNECLESWHWHTGALEGKALALIAIENYDNAISVLDEPLQSGRINPNYYRIRAQAKWQRNTPGDREGAWEDINEAININPKDSKNYFINANFYVALADESVRENNSQQYGELLQKAIDALCKGRDFSPPNYKPVFRNRLVCILIQLNDVERAIAEAEKSVLENSNYVQNWMALTAARLAGKRWKQANDAAENGLKVSLNTPGSIWCNFFKAVALACQGEDSQIINRLFKEIEESINETPYFHPPGGIYGAVVRSILVECRSSIEPSNFDLLCNGSKRIFQDNSFLDIE